MRFLIVLASVAVWLTGCAEKPEPPPRAESKPAAVVKILQFYASSGLVEKGKPVTVCYGVENAKSVRVEPPVEELKPALNRCFQVTPTRETTYTLVAEGFDGKTISESFTIKVVAGTSAFRQPPMIRFFGTSAPEIVHGQSATLCYRVEKAVAVSLKPNVQPLEPSEKFCFSVSPSGTTTYILTATGPDGKTESQQLTITVR